MMGDPKMGMGDAAEDDMEDPKMGMDDPQMGLGAN